MLKNHGLLEKFLVLSLVCEEQCSLKTVCVCARVYVC